MVLCKAESLRDVVAFPKVKDASEIMSACPSVVEKENLDVLGIAVVEKNEE
jgi:aspartyl-tRNA synthetase